MMQQTLLQVKKRIQEADSIKEDKKKELLELLTILELEIDKLAKTNQEHAESIVGFTQASAHESTRKEKREDLHQLSLQGLAGTIQGFESSNPRLVEIVNSICTALSNLGI
jgi:queuine/archaeosine tRNA-ribosyltransferase